MAGKDFESVQVWNIEWDLELVNKVARLLLDSNVVSGIWVKYVLQTFPHFCFRFRGLESKNGTLALSCDVSAPRNYSA